jgi:hypothetical protein
MSADNIFDAKAEQESPFAPAPIAPETALPAITGAGNYPQLWDMATLISRSDIIPAPYKGKPENCFIAVELAQRIGTSALAVMQNMVPIQGKPSWSSQFLISAVNGCGRFTPLRFEWVGTEGQDDWGCRAYATELNGGEKLTGTTVTMAMAKAEGWLSRAGSKWKTMPGQMLMYRAGSFWSRVYAPELAMGVLTTEEREDMKNVTPGGPVPAVEDTAAEREWEARKNGQ